MRLIIGLVAILILGAFITSNFRATIAEPATSTTSVIATSGLAASNATANAALGSALVIQQLTFCVLPLALLVVIALGLVAFIIARKNQVVPQPLQAMQPRPSPIVMIERAPTLPSVSTPPAALSSPRGDAPTFTPRRRRAARARGAARVAGRWFK